MHQKVQKNNKIVSESAKMGIKINTDKTEVQLITKGKKSINIRVARVKFKQGEEFVYMGGKSTLLQ